MQFQTPITISQAIQRIESGEYVIPVIQRDFVWQAKQIERLFDSLMRDYPIGSFLFWEVTSETMAQYPFFRFSRNVIRGGDNHRNKADTDRDKAIGVLDGQQRLTAFLVGLSGSFRGKSKVSKPPQQYLYLDLLHYDDEAGEEDLAYKFQLMDADKFDTVKDDPTAHWFRVGDILKLADATEVFKYLEKYQLQAADGVFVRLEKLRKSIMETEVINFYLETRDDLGEVLNVFVRLNRSGTTLSYPDLLLSAATIGWKAHNAPAEFKACVKEMNSRGFDFTRDRVLKAGLVLADLEDIKFKAANFKSSNAVSIEDQWEDTRRSLILASKLLRQFGLDKQTLTAQNAIIPVAYYLKLTGRTDLYLTSLAHQEDRDNIRKFVILSLLKSGFWTGAVDQVLTTLRQVIVSHGSTSFPLDEILKALAAIKKPLTLSDLDVDGLLAARYGKPSTALILSLLYPIDMTTLHHQDHVVPRARLTESKLMKLGLSRAQVEQAMDRRDKLPNLQLLQGHLNVQKSKMPISEFLKKLTPKAKRDHFVDINDLGQVPVDETEFNAFYDAREQAMRTKLLALVE